MHVLTNSKKNYIDRIKYDFTQLKKGQLRARTHIRILNTNVVGEARKGGGGTTIFLNTFASFDIVPDRKTDLYFMHTDTMN